MELNVKEAGPSNKHLDPTIQIKIKIEYDEYEVALTGFEGRLEADDGKILTSLYQWSKVEGTSSTKKESMQLGAEPENFDSEYGGSKEYTTTLYAPIGTDGFNYIEEMREKNQKRHVNLKVVVDLWVLENIARFSTIQNPKPKNYDLENIGYGTSESILVHTSNLETYQNLNFLEISNNLPGYLESQHYVYSNDIDISSNDWNIDYAPQLGNTERMIVEFDYPTDLSSSDTSKALNAAVSELKEVKEEIQRGEWRSAISMMLGIYDSIDQEELWDLQDVGYTEQAQSRLNGLRKCLNNYLGEFRHRRTRKGELKDKTEPLREEVYFLYMMFSGLVQLLATKHEAKQD